MQWLRREAGAQRKLAIRGFEGILCEGGENVGQKQLLMLLLMIEAELDRLERGIR